jgi:contactin associated protein-like 2
LLLKLILKGNSAWTPIETNYYQFLTFELVSKKKIRKIATLGRADTKEYVLEYIIQFSDDGETWRTITDTNGENQVER